MQNGPVVFEDVSKQAGLTAWHYAGGSAAKSYIVESLGSGVALLDYDNDGWLDIYLVNGMTYDAINGKAESPHAALFHNNHDGTFTQCGGTRWRDQRSLGRRRRRRRLR